MSEELEVREESSEELEKYDDTKKNSGVLKNIILIGFSNVCNIIAGVLLAILVPKIMAKTEYGYYKTFTLYASYLGLLHFGICDGVFLKYAGKNFDDLDKKKFGVFTRVLFASQLIISVILILVGLIFLPKLYKVIFLLLAIDLLGVNITTYYELISQVTSRFKMVALRNVVKGMLTIISVAVLLVLYKAMGYSPSYIVVSACVVGVNVILSLWYVISYRSITFGHFDKVRDHKDEIKELYKVGIILLLSSFVTNLIFAADQQTVNILFSTEEYAAYAFAYNMVSLITIASNAASVVLFPTLNKTNDETIKNNYSTLNSNMLMFMALAMISYFPIDVFVTYFLPKYTDSLIIFRVIMPGLFISSCVTVIKGNIYKKFDHIKRYLVYAIIVLILSIITNIIAYNICKSMTAISIASVITLVIWYMLTEGYMIKKYHVKFVKNALYIILICASYYLCFLIKNIYISFVIYLACYLVITIPLYFNEIKNIINKKRVL